MREALGRKAALSPPPQYHQNDRPRSGPGCRASAARLLEADPDLGALIAERLDPGTMLVEVAESDDDAATTIAAGILRKLWQPALALPAPTEGTSALCPLESWCAAYDRDRAALARGAGGFPAAAITYEIPRSFRASRGEAISRPTSRAIRARRATNW